ncbi:uncharacterized protein BO80DRAFT_131509 [Aspergillus ibericus CBS 121593]|uniref:Uncharacterized protein n=1 Tax=Aspergillus ibericus CBS 121593 TaxID=1448316 RepID=A0A395HBB2_9EURO|nr:hypothetical protein BO80DRAFT_131509 [Aspergillus ibericus CBS 121593]RAL05231.1 hypothetical protein BO80DRAFT_131509 [Aspergillus ibericus CBS 121593]
METGGRQRSSLVVKRPQSVLVQARRGRKGDRLLSESPKDLIPLPDETRLRGHTPGQLGGTTTRVEGYTSSHEQLTLWQGCPGNQLESAPRTSPTNPMARMSGRQIWRPIELPPANSIPPEMMICCLLCRPGQNIHSATGGLSVAAPGKNQQSGPPYRRSAKAVPFLYLPSIQYPPPSPAYPARSWS